jgi:hypothetical protein
MSKAADTIEAGGVLAGVVGDSRVLMVGDLQRHVGQQWFVPLPHDELTDGAATRGKGDRHDMAERCHRATLPADLRQMAGARRRWRCRG